MTPLIRPATPADVPLVLPMVDALTRLHTAWDRDRFAVVPHVLSMYASWLPERAQDPQSVFLVGEVDAHLAGFLVATVEDSIPIYWTPACGWIHDVWVQPQFRRRGVAHALVRACLDRFTSMGVTQVRGETAFANEHSRAMLRSLGFREATIEMMRVLPPDQARQAPAAAPPPPP